MNLHEYQGKQLLSKYGVAIQRGVVVENASEIDAALKQLREETNTEFAVVKAQIHAGGRGKGGRVKVGKNEGKIKE